MTANERIEALLNKVNQTISDLPIIDTTSQDYYDKIDTLVETAKQFDAANGDDFYSVAHYALHLSDVIDRMEIGLENYLIKNEENDEADHNTYEIAYNVGVKDGQIKAYKELVDEMRDLVTDVVYALLPNTENK